MRMNMVLLSALLLTFATYPQLATALIYGENNIISVTEKEYSEYSGANHITCRGKVMAGGAAFHVERADIIVTTSHTFYDLETFEVADPKDCLYNVTDKKNEVVERIPIRVARIATLEKEEWDGDTEHDYAVLKLAWVPSKAEIHIFPVDDAFDGKTASIRTIGFHIDPQTKLVTRYKSDGIVYGKELGDMHYDSLTLYAHDADSISGFSGGPVISMRTGKVIGINRGSHKLPGEPREGATFSTKRNANEFIIFDDWVMARIKEFAEGTHD